MKLNTAITICYFVYFSIAAVLTPVNNLSETYSCKSAAPTEEITHRVAEPKVEVLHSEMLFADF